MYSIMATFKATADTQSSPILKEDASQLSPFSKEEDASQLCPTLKEDMVLKNTAPHVQSCISMTRSVFHHM